MKLALFCVVLAAASLVIVSQAAAQVSYSTTGPTGVVGWSSPATGCLIDPSSAPVAFFSAYVNGVVSAKGVFFAPAAHGTILLRCPVQGIMNLLAPGDINGFALKFNNASFFSQPGCTIQAQLLPNSVAPGITIPDPYSAPVQGIVDAPPGETTLQGILTAEMALSAPLNTSQTYEVDITLTRTRLAATLDFCNPVTFGAFLEELNKLQ